MMKMPVVFTGHGSPMIALENNDLTAAMADIGTAIIKNYGQPGCRNDQKICGNHQCHNRQTCIWTSDLQQKTGFCCFFRFIFSEKR